MASDASTATAPNGTDALLQSLVRGARGRALRVQLAARYPDCSPDAIEEAIQYACKSFLDEAEGISAPGQVYAWIRTAAHRSLGREADLHHRELMVDSVEDGLEEVSAEDPGPVEELIALEDDADLSMLVEEVSSSLSDRRRDVLALYGAGYKRPQIAERLGLTERAVKRDLLEIMDQARGRSWRGWPAAAAIAASPWSCASSAASPRRTSPSRRESTFPIAAAASCSASAWSPGGRRPARCFPPRWSKARAPACSGGSRTHRRRGSRRLSSRCSTAAPR
jgi:RNA polymerase sigma factor (sigma-70 family)